MLFRTINIWKWVFKFLRIEVSTHQGGFYAPRKFLRTDYEKNSTGITDVFHCLKNSEAKVCDQEIEISWKKSVIKSL